MSGVWTASPRRALRHGMLAGAVVLGLVAGLLPVLPAAAAPAGAPSEAESGPGWREAVLGLVGAGTGASEPTLPRSVDLGVPGVPRVEPVQGGARWPAPTRTKELAGRRTENATFFELSDGRMQAEISQEPVHYRDGKGVLRPIDTTVRPSRRTAGFPLANETNGFTTLFGARSNRLMRFEADGRHIELGAAGPSRAVTAQVDGSTVTYAGLADGADVVYEVTPTSVKENIVLAKRPAGGFSYTFSVNAGGLTAVPRADGSVGFVDGDGQTLFVMPPPFMFDSGDDPSSPVGKGYSDRVTQTVVQRGPTSFITITADAAWLADPARNYPVTIDPTVKIQPVPSDARDVQIYSGDVNRNYDGTYQLKVGTDATQSWRSLLRFPLIGVPAGTVIDDAQLQLYYSQTHTSYDYDVAMEARRVTADWSESTATWSNTNANVAPQAAGNTVRVDDGDGGTSVTGTWAYSGNAALTPLAVNADYRFNNDGAAGDTHTWVPTLTEAGDYQVEVHFVSESDRAANVPYTVHYNGGTKAYTVDQTGVPAAGRWTTLGVHNFAAGTAGKVVVGDVAGKSVIVDAVRFTKWGVTTKKRGVSSVWSSFPVRDVVQDWVNGTQANHGFMIKAVDENLKGRGGPIFEGAEYAYANDRRDYNLPKLVLTWGRPAVAVNPPTTVTATGAALTWPAYTDPSTAPGDDIAEYQVHRSVYQTFAPSSATLVAPVAKTATAFQDTTATPTPTAETDPLKRNFFYYMVVVKTADGQLIPGPTQGALLPKAGQVTKILRETTANAVPDTTLSQLQPTVNLNMYGTDPYVAVGNNSTVHGDTRALLKFTGLPAGIPAGARVVDAQLQLWNAQLLPGTVTDGKVDVHRLTRAFDETTATWNNAASGTPWTAPGGDYDPTAESYVDGFTNDPEWQSWDVSDTVTSWLASPTTNHGLLLRMRDEVAATQRAMMLNSESPEALLRPTLQVTYLEKTASSTYYAPTTPDLMSPATTYTTPVTISNPTATPWTSAAYELSYHWALPDGSDVTGSSNQVATPLPSDIAAGATVDITAQVKTPAGSLEGNQRTDYVLRWELRNKSTGQWLSQEAGIASLDQPAAVVEPTSDQLGMESFYSYAGTVTGGGGALATNVYSGNSVWSYSAFANPSRGVATQLRMAYNSRDTSDAGAGFGWSVQASSLVRLGTALDFHPNPNPTKVTLTDGDGTGHTFSWNSTTSTWDSPKGVHLYLQRLVDCGPKTEESRAWVATRPDRVQFFFDCDGYPSAIVDKNGNELLFTYESRQAQNKPTKYLRYITDATGRQTMTVEYWAKGDTYDYIDDTTWAKVTGVAGLTNPHIIDHVRRITDISGRKVTFTYTDKGLLGEMIDGAGSSQPKVFAFAYDMTQGNKNVKLVRATDPRGAVTDVAYYDTPDDEPRFKWWTKAHTDRLDNVTAVSYVDPDGPTGAAIHATITDPESHTSVEVLDGYGRATQLTDAKSRITKVGWDDDHNVVRIEEPNGAVSTWAYDQKTGYPTLVRSAEANANGWPGTTLAYQTGLDGHWADLIASQSPEGRRTTYGYSVEGDLTRVTDPVGNTTPAADDYTTFYTHDTWGQVRTVKDANGNVAHIDDYDPSGMPRLTTDALGHTSSMQFDVRGNAVSVTDPNGKTSTYTYDHFGRGGQTRIPFQAGTDIVMPAPDYDANGNVVRTVAANGAERTYVWDVMDRVTSSTEPPDTVGGTQRRTTYGYDKVGNLLRQVKPKGTLTTGDPDDFVQTYRYDEVYQLLSGVNADGGTVTVTYDNVGNVLTVADPKRTASTDPDDFTTKFTYDRDHRPKTETDAAGFVATVEYDRDGVTVATTGRDGKRTTFGYDARGLLAEVKVPHETVGATTTYRTTRYEYDQVGNRVKAVSPRGVATTDDPDDFADITVYDPMNRVKEQILPYDRDDVRYNAQDKIIKTYDKVGNLVKVSSPPSAGQTVRNDTAYTYFDNGWLASSTDAWSMKVRYEYNTLGQQTKRVMTGSDGAIGRTQTATYFPDGKLKSTRDEGLPTGTNALVVDNSDLSWVTMSGPQPWTSASTGTDHQGYDYLSHPAGTGANTIKWESPPITEEGPYDIFIRYPAVQGAATNATVKVTVGQEVVTVTLDQTQRTGEWINLGRYWFDRGYFVQKVELTDNANGVVSADAVKFVRYDSSVDDIEFKSVSYAYDANGNLVSILDASSDAVTDEYVLGYDVLDRNTTVQEKDNGAVKHTGEHSYDANSNLTRRKYDAFITDVEHDVRNQVTKVTNSTVAGEIGTKVTTYGYDALGRRKAMTRANGNTWEAQYFDDGPLKHLLEKTSAGVVVAEHTLAYDGNGNRTNDTVKLRRSDDPGAYLNRTHVYTYDPRDRVVSAVKTAGADVYKELYTYDANSNVVQQTMDKTVAGTAESATTDNVYDRNRLLKSITAGQSTSYHHDAFGRLVNMTAPLTLGWYRYDAFDRKVENYTFNDRTEPGGNTRGRTTTYQFDSLDRMTERDTTEEVSGTPGGLLKTTYHYLGASDQLTHELGVYGNPAYGNAYHYGPNGELLLQDQKYGAEPNRYWYHSYDPHGSVEAITGPDGSTGATYGYTAYGSADEFLTQGDGTGGDHVSEPLNTVRYNGRRMDWTSGTYDMGSRHYNPSINRFLTPDSFGGGMADQALSMGAGTANRYGFAGGNPVNFIDLEGHNAVSDVLGGIGEFFSTIGGYLGEQAMGVMALGMTCMGDGAEACVQMVGGGLDPLLSDPIGYAKQYWHDLTDPIRESWANAHYGAATAYAAIAVVSVTRGGGKPKSRDVFDWGDSTSKHGGSVRYGGLDQYGRPTLMFASIDKSMLDKGRPAGNARPAGWPGNGTHYNVGRGHLLAERLGGRPMRKRGIVTMTQEPTNSPIMRDMIEDVIYRAVDAGEVVQYSVIPQYVGDNLIAKSFLISAYGNKGFVLPPMELPNPAGMFGFDD